jgi:D-alanine-D-alanine ligase
MLHSGNKVREQVMMSHNLPVPHDQLLIWAFIPYCTTEDGLYSEYYDYPSNGDDLEKAFAELGIEWKWQPVTFENMHAIIDEVIASANDYIPVVLNYCDGDDINGYPGISLVKLLEANSINFTGANSTFYDLTTSKIVMKDVLVKAGVQTSPYEVILDPNNIQGIFQRLGTPLIVKPAISGGSCGISLKSVVHNDEELSVQVQRLLLGQHGLQFTPDSIYAERFITGREFTVLIVGSASQPDHIKIYPALETLFPPNLPEAEQFLTYDRYWEMYEEESPPPPGERFARYQSVTDPSLGQHLCELSWRAYCAVGGTGYGRVDLRMDKISQEIFVLEVNSNCGVTADDETPVGHILRLSDTSYAQLLTEFITDALGRNQVK